ncbi:MAG: hypothetical protein JWR38_5114 [Mucilaginibacter sp.]|nr:hypothetical protein [Mucilaginibacter sp.]
MDINFYLLLINSAKKISAVKPKQSVKDFSTAKVA